MFNEAVDAWLSLFHENAANAWAIERQELRNAAMLITALDMEFKRIRIAVDDEFFKCQKKFNAIETACSPHSKSSQISRDGKENKIPRDFHSVTEVAPLQEANNHKQALSPKQSSNESIGEFNKSSECDEIFLDQSSSSPTINKTRKYSRLKRARDYTSSFKSLDVNITPKKSPEVIVCDDSFANTPDKKQDVDEDIIIDVTPEPPHDVKKFKFIKGRNWLKQKKKFNSKDIKESSNSTITQMFSLINAKCDKSEKDLKKCEDTDFTYCSSQDIKAVNETKFSSKVKQQNYNLPCDIGATHKINDSDLTYCLTSDIHYVTAQENNVESITMSDKVNEETSKKDISKTPCKTKIPFKTKPVRGKERLELEGWDCDECKKFYELMGDDVTGAKDLMNKCSRHRSKFKPDDYTIPGFWNLDFTPTQKPLQNDSTIFNF